MLISMSIPSKSSAQGPLVHGHAKQDHFQYRTITNWQLPKLKTGSQSITPASTPSRTSFSTSSSPPMTAQRSFTTSPDGLIGLELCDLERIPSLTLPTSPPPSQPTSPRADPSICCRPSGLIRRFSRGASNRLKGRSSVSNMKTNRDQNAGTVIRRRSDSRSVVDGSYDISDMELEDTVEEEAAEAQSPRVVDVAFPTPRLPPRTLSRRSSEKDTNRVPGAQLKATIFMKITKKKRKQLRFSLDEGAAKICWVTNLSNVRKQVYIDDIREIRIGDKAKNYLAEFQIGEEFLSRWFTVVYFDPERRKGRAIKFMHLIAPDPSTCDQWVRALQHLMRARDDIMSGMVANKEKHWIGHWHREMIKRFGTNQHAGEDEKMDFASMRRTCRNFSIYKSERALRALFESITKNRYDTLNQQQYLEFFRRLTERRDVRRVFDEAKISDDPEMSLSEFINFLRCTQLVNVDPDPVHWLAVFNKFAMKKKGPVLEGQAEEDDLNTGMTFEAFRDFLSSSHNPALKPLPSAVCLDRPMNEYFISSSHNTYLEGRQVRGESSSEMYIQALRKGCRCIEIDCENGVDGRPCVTHVKTATTRVPFVECIKAINQYAFFASDYPLIVSLEVHCNAEQQKLMAEIMKDEFGERLLLQPLTDGSYALPSPENLKRKILIKVKVPREAQPFPLLVTFPPITVRSAPPAAHRRQRSLSAPNPRLVQQSLGKVSEKSMRLPLSSMSPTLQSLTIMTPISPVMAHPSSTNTSAPVSSSDDSEIDVGQNSSPKKSKAKSNIVRELGELGVYTRGVKFNDWKSIESRSPNHVYSFNENTFENKCKTPEGRALLEKHNTRCLMRIYPRPTRFYSSNFDPLQFWRTGVQMVATNWQTYDLGTQINDAMFAAGADRTGYVLKPEELRRPSTEAGPGQVRKLENKLVTFSVDILSAQHLEAPAELRPDSDMNPYVEFEMHCAEDRAKDIAIGEGGLDASARNGKSGLGSPIRKRTRIVEGNGFDPVFSETEKETITVTLKTKYPSLVFVRWTVWNSPDGRNLSSSKEPMSTFTAKISSLEQGYRQLPLYNKHGELLHSKLFCRIRKEHRSENDVEQAHDESFLEHRRISEENGRTGKDFLRRVFSGRTPAEKKRVQRDNESGYFSRTASMERYVP